MTGLDELLAERSLDALLVVAGSGRDPLIAPFVGSAHLGTCFVLAASARPPLLAYWSPMERQEAASTGLDLLSPEALDVVRWARQASGEDELWADVLAQAFRLAGLGPGRLALAGHADAGDLHAACLRLEQHGWHFAPGAELVARLGKRKSPAALAEIQRTAAGTMKAFEMVAELLAAAETVRGELHLEGRPLSVGRLRGAVAMVLAAAGLEQPHGSLLAAAEEGAVPHNTGSDQRLLRAGESLVVDLFPRGSMYADCTRTFCVGEPSAELAAGYRSVRAAIELAESLAVEQADCWQLQEAVCAHFAVAGHPTPLSDPGATRGYVHGLGHGVGFEVHELPSFRREAEGASGQLEVGDVFTLEPGLYEPEAGWAVRLENLYHLGPDGLENLTPLPMLLDPREWG